MTLQWEWIGHSDIDWALLATCGSTAHKVYYRVIPCASQPTKLWRARWDSEPTGDGNELRYGPLAECITACDRDAVKQQGLPGESVLRTAWKKLRAGLCDVGAVSPVGWSSVDVMGGDAIQYDRALLPESCDSCGNFYHRNMATESMPPYRIHGKCRRDGHLRHWADDHCQLHAKAT